MNTNLPLKSSSKADRKAIEKNRRIHMKCLYSQLNSLVNHDGSSSSSRVILTLPEQIDEATMYIKKLQENLKNLKKKKDNLISTAKGISNKDSEKISRKYYNNRSSAVQIEINEKGNSVEVILITGLECQFVFTEAIRIFHEEKAEIVNASYSVRGNTVFHTIHAQTGLRAM
ncbi:transcription factor bHLH162-like isoform X2 [Amaranthus tricolor]|uniref:transcription factor bHLH162-like isoform X2 n=1 Tax=Amaranthus tricolor TaxID=29722 RepID=UPI002590B03F|nr:transcription factor bHLH162-like isoform X2 [Amaranthus tricolor]